MKNLIVTAMVMLIGLWGNLLFGGSGCCPSSSEKKTLKKSDTKNQTVCPVMGGKINKDQYVDVKGKRIYVCCMGCISKIKKNPEEYIKKLEAEGVKIQELKKQTTCPVMEGNPVKKSLFADVKGKRIYVCCQGCISAIEQDPDKYLKMLEKEGILVEDAPEKKDK